MVDKFVRSVAEALAGIKDGSTVLIAGFAQVGEPRALIDGLIETGARDLTVVHNTAGRGREGVARLIGEGRVRKILCSFARSRGSVIFEEVFARGAIELEILPQGTMAERMRAAAAGIPAFYTATAAGTKLAEGKEARVFNGREYILEHALPGDVALVEAWRADRWGNLVYREAGRNFNPVMGPAPPADKINPWLVNASRQHVPLQPGGSYVSHSDSFALVRGGHLDLCVLGAFQVAENGDLANWARSDDDNAPAIGGAMDLAAGAKRIWIVMEHNPRSGEARLLSRCSNPLAPPGCR